jgi:hypothetical protein
VERGSWRLWKVGLSRSKQLTEPHFDNHDFADCDDYALTDPHCYNYALSDPGCGNYAVVRYWQLSLQL